MKGHEMEKRCRNCRFAEPQIVCDKTKGKKSASFSCNCEKFMDAEEWEYVKESLTDQLIHGAVYEGGSSFYVGPEFGCIHWEA